MSIPTPLAEVAAPKGLVGGPFGSSLVNRDYTPSGVPVVRGTNLGFGRFLGGEYVFVSAEKVAKDLARNTAAPRDIVFTQRGTLGQVALVPDHPYTEYVVSQSQMRLRVDPSKASPEYLYYACSTPAFRKQVDDHAISTGVPHINLLILNRLTVPLPRLQEQQAIAEVLGALDDKIATNIKLTQTAAALGKAKFEAALATGSDECELREIALNAPGKYLSKEKYADGGEHFVYGSNSIMGKHTEWLFEGKFLVLAKIGSYCGNLRWSQRPAWVNNNASAIVPRSQVPPAFLRHSVERLDMAPYRAGTGQPYIRMESLFSAQVSIPTSSTNSVLAETLDNLLEIEARAGDENEKLVAIRDMFLPQLMSGKLRVKDAADVVGSLV